MPATVANLDTTPGSVSAAHISGLHRAAARRVGKGGAPPPGSGDLHEVLGYWAWERFGVDSLKHLSKAQASELMGSMGVRPVKPYAEKRTHGPGPGVIRLMAPWHAGHIRKLATQLAWDDHDLKVWLMPRYGVGKPEQLETARRAGQVIQALKLKLEACTPAWSNGQ